MPKVLVISTIASTIDRFNRRNLAMLQTLGCECHVATNFAEPDPDRSGAFRDELEGAEIHTHHLEFNRSPRYGGLKRSYRLLLSLLAHEQFDLVHVQTPIAASVTRAATIRMGRNRPSVLYTAHGFHFFRGGPAENWMYYPIEAILGRFTDCIITINEEDFARASKFCGNVRLVSGVGVDASVFRPAASDRERCDIRRANDIEADAFVITIVGELNGNKNQQVAVRALADLVADHPQTLLLLVGEGPTRSMLASLVAELGVGGNVRFLGFRADVAELLRATDVVVSTSIREGLPVNVIEAKLTGVPCVITDTRGSRDLVSDGLTGLVVPAGDPQRLSRALKRLMLRPSWAVALGAASQRNAGRYHASSIDAEMRSIYLDCLRGGLGPCEPS